MSVSSVLGHSSFDSRCVCGLVGVYMVPGVCLFYFFLLFLPGYLASLASSFIMAGWASSVIISALLTRAFPGTRLEYHRVSEDYFILLYVLFDLCEVEVGTTQVQDLDLWGCIHLRLYLYENLSHTRIQCLMSDENLLESCRWDIRF